MGPRRRKIRTAARSRSPRAWVLGPGLKRGSKIIAAHTGREGSGRAASACYDGAPPRAVRDLDLESIRWLWPDDMTDHPHRRDGCLAAGCPACTATPDGVDNSMWLSYPNSCFWRPSPTYRALIGTRANVGWKRRSPLPPPPRGPKNLTHGALKVSSAGRAAPQCGRHATTCSTRQCGLTGPVRFEPSTEAGPGVKRPTGAGGEPQSGEPRHSCLRGPHPTA